MANGSVIGRYLVLIVIISCLWVRYVEVDSDLFNHCEAKVKVVAWQLQPLLWKCWAFIFSTPWHNEVVLREEVLQEAVLHDEMLHEEVLQNSFLNNCPQTISQEFLNIGTHFCEAMWTPELYWLETWTLPLLGIEPKPLSWQASALTTMPLWFVRYL